MSTSNGASNDNRQLVRNADAADVEAGKAQGYQQVPGGQQEDEFGEDAKCPDEQEIPSSPLSEDLYGFATVAIMRDCHFLAEPGLTRSQRSVRYCRLTISIMMTLMNTSLQVYLIYNVKKFITAATVLNVRSVYDQYEVGMYDDHFKTVNGNNRGVPGSFEPGNFSLLSEMEKEETCQIPLSQPDFLLVFIFLWSLTCLSDVSIGLKVFHKIFFIIKPVSSMKDCMKRDPSDPAIREVVGITLPVRFAILFLVILPRLVVGLGLTWLGCRWLIATNSFADLFLNAVALGFVFDLKDTFYNQLLPDRNKRDVQNTLFPPTVEKEAATIGAYVQGLLILPVTLGWAVFYIYRMQAVLPHYMWDVHEVCKEWLIQHYAV